MGVGQAHRLAAPGGDEDERRGQVAAPRGRGRWRSREARRLVGGLEIEVVHRATSGLVEGAHLGGQGPLALFVEVRRHPRVEHDERPVPRHRRGDLGHVGDHVAALQAWGSRSGSPRSRWRRAGGRTARGCRATGRPGATGPRRLSTGRRGRGRGRRGRPCWAAPASGRLSSSSADRAAEPDPRGRPAGAWVSSPSDGSVAEGVVVEEQVEAGGRTRGRAGRVGLPAVQLGHVAEPGQQGGAAADLVGLRASGWRSAPPARPGGSRRSR